MSWICCFPVICYKVHRPSQWLRVNVITSELYGAQINIPTLGASPNQILNKWWLTSSRQFQSKYDILALLFEIEEQKWWVRNRNTYCKFDSVWLTGSHFVMYNLQGVLQVLNILVINIQSIFPTLLYVDCSILWIWPIQQKILSRLQAIFLCPLVLLFNTFEAWSYIISNPIWQRLVSGIALPVTNSVKHAHRKLFLLLVELLIDECSYKNVNNLLPPRNILHWIWAH